MLLAKAGTRNRRLFARPCSSAVGLAINSAKNEAQVLRNKIRLQPPDKTDIVGALRRREMREYLRGMIAKDRNAYISRARENMDPDVALARIARGSPPPGVWRRLPGCACGLAGRRGATS